MRHKNHVVRQTYIHIVDFSLVFPSTFVYLFLTPLVFLLLIIHISQIFISNSEIVKMLNFELSTLAYTTIFSTDLPLYSVYEITTGSSSRILWPKNSHAVTLSTVLFQILFYSF